MNINVYKITKKYHQNLVIKNFSYKFYNKNSYVITGSNGSGKSTLMKIISGYLSPNSGIIEYEKKNKIINEKSLYKYNSMIAPYIEIIEEFTLEEFLKFHFSFKKKKYIHINDTIKFLELQKNSKKHIKNFSSGMKQKLKIGLAILENLPIILLDEPMSNLDKKNKKWYIKNIKKIINKKLIIIFSNEPSEYNFFKKLKIIKI